ncbi:MAG: SRPBCC domain-containing protein [Bacteroidales bacterium]|nr:SRPBCC domain-containing protein [Bacteroidales bacterium]MCF8402927.1 SRPBCC domain-containing protein [Bacteroidales bacterium]
MKSLVKVEIKIPADINRVWEYWTSPEHITHWNFASDQWCCPSAVNNLQAGGELNWRMEAKDGSMGFDFTGTYDQVIDKKMIACTLTDGRKLNITFSIQGKYVILTETFEAEGTHSLEQQQAGWQAILENFKKYVES